ncbi:hypothetical protein [Desulfolutivibrio sulfoxidireducens]|uniref:hypothetical protein n=1 Tax=Desulfolutivibrio sulfoxidireducens TaxID=2773299 RepID=UPI00159EB0AA|nr:hypothetical protein [Desulfolutivibrio sulfoxidireducens]QLA16288.1 hypothetical protein GD605_09240 [Desulfolutivibrio sulfoxidireducens]QLA19820.1 hypothetical protein GD604_08760 [Desulfolutivibrio sulfoxidireducens]
MEIDIVPADVKLPIERAFTLSIVIKSFKGRKDVEVHLFRPEWDPAEAQLYDWNALFGDLLVPDLEVSLESCRRVVLESFTKQERDQLVDYLKERYKDRLAAIRSCCLNFPIPLGLVALSELSEGKDAGFVNFDKVPNYSLPFPVRGFFDLSQHKPLIEGPE